MAGNHYVATSGEETEHSNILIKNVVISGSMMYGFKWKKFDKV